MVTATEKRKADQKRRGHAVVAVRAALNGYGISTAAVDNMPCLIGPGGKHILVVALPDAIDTVAIVASDGTVRMVEVRADA
jgi:hypothetical protein